MDTFLKSIPSGSSETESQQPQESPRTITPPIKTPSPHEIEKPADLQGQPLQQSIAVTNQNQMRPAPQAYYQPGSVQQAPRNGPQVVGIQGIGGGGGHPTAVYPQHGASPMPPRPVYMQGQVPLHSSHAVPHQQPVYAMHSQMQSFQYSRPLPRHQYQWINPNYQPTIKPNTFGYYSSGPTTQYSGYYQAPQDSQTNYTSPGAGVVGHATAHTASPLPESVYGLRAIQERFKRTMNIVNFETEKNTSSDQIYKDHDNRAAPKPQKSEPMFKDGSNSCGSLNGLLSMEQIHHKLLGLMADKEKNSLENICGWISRNVSKKARDQPEFINVLLTAILEVSIEPSINSWQFKVYKFQNLQGLITRYIDVNINMSELQCLIAIQEYMQQLDGPQRVLLQVLEKQLIGSILYSDVTRASQSNGDSSPSTGKSTAMIALKTFFAALNEAYSESSYE